jgi:hypothetical protein
MSEEERRRSKNEQLAQVQAAPPEVLAAMMVSLGFQLRFMPTQ